MKTMISVTALVVVLATLLSVSTSSQISSHQDERPDQPIINMFEVVLATIETKLQRVENLDRAVHHLMRKMDMLERKLLGKDADIMQAVLDLEKQNSEAHVSVKLNQLSAKLDNLCQHTSEDNRVVKDESDIFLAEPSIRKSRVLGGFHERSDHDTMMDDVKEVINGIDQRLGVHINIVSENLGKMSNMVEEVRNAILEEDLEDRGEPGLDAKTIMWLNSQNHRGHNQSAIGSNKHKRRSKFDKLLTSIHPLLAVKDKVEQLVPKSEELLSQTQRQERAISNIHNDLKEKTNLIMKELSDVERELLITKKSGAAVDEQTRVRSDKTDQGIRSSSVMMPMALPLIRDIDSSEVTTMASAASTVKLSLSSTEMEEDETTGATRGPSVVFPSIENKPIVANSTFSYQFGRNKSGVEGSSCADLYRKGIRKSGTFYLQIEGTRFWYLKVYCDMETDGGGWMVMQRRDDFGEPRENFNRDWHDYKYGFGDPNREVWLGNENVHLLTNSEDYELRVELADFEGNIRYAYYEHFKLGNESDFYKLQIGGYHGNAGDSLNDNWYGSNLKPFSTFDNDNDRSSLNCASMLKGGWWWKSCGRGLNGLYLTDPQDLTARQGIVWFRWRGWDYSLKRSQMMIRPMSLSTKS